MLLKVKIPVWLIDIHRYIFQLVKTFGNYMTYYDVDILFMGLWLLKNSVKIRTLRFFLINQDFHSETEYLAYVSGLAIKKVCVYIYISFFLKY